jgi:hypothetical protein
MPYLAYQRDEVHTMIKRGPANQLRGADNQLRGTDNRLRGADNQLRGPAPDISFRGAGGELPNVN